MSDDGISLTIHYTPVPVTPVHRPAQTATAAKRGELRLVEHKDGADRTIREFVGDKDVWMGEFRAQSLYVQTGFRFPEGMNKGSGAPLDQNSPMWNAMLSRGEI